MFELSKQGAVDVIRCQAPLSRDHGDEFSQTVDECIGRGQPRIVLNLEQVPLIDSKGLELLVEYQQRCMERGGCMKLAAPTTLCKDILTVTDVAANFEVFDDPLTAAGSFAQ